MYANSSVCVYTCMCMCVVQLFVYVCLCVSRGGGEEEEGKRGRGRGGGGNHSPHTLESLFLSHDIITFTNIGYCMRLVAMAIE